MSDLRDAALSAKAWPFEEARRVLKRYQKAPPDKGYSAMVASQLREHFSPSLFQEPLLCALVG